MRLGLCVEHIPNPDIVGERMKLDMIARQANQIDETTQPAANPSLNRKRRI